jgi:hypothetical protein
LAVVAQPVGERGVERVGDGGSLVDRALAQLGARGDDGGETLPDLPAVLRVDRANVTRTTSKGVLAGGAAATPSAASATSSSWPWNRISRLSAKCRKSVVLVTFARSAICAAVVASYPRSAKSSTAARRRRPRVSGSHRATHRV